MGYRYAHNDKQLFDMNYGLFQAKTTDEIKKAYTHPRRNTCGGTGSW
jgi:hypothetical protein